MKLPYISIKDWCKEHQEGGWNCGGKQEHIYFFDYDKTDKMLMLSADDGEVYYADGSVFERNGLMLTSPYHIVGYDKNPSPIKIGGE